MKKAIAVFTALMFVVLVTGLHPVEGSQSNSGDASGEASGKATIYALIVGIAVTIVIIALGGAASSAISNSISKKDRDKEELSLLMHELGSINGLKPNIALLADLYGLSVNTTENEITALIAEGGIDLKKALRNSDTAKKAFWQISQRLKRKSMSLNRFEKAKIHKLNAYIFACMVTHQPIDEQGVMKAYFKFRTGFQGE